ncbi:DeoR/GlpR family DNA-binding transcription regulator [Saccharospirillum salsuginis]|uniref:Glycerol-3-phosphate regulon repressor n=1 Tax=Saccharospirillum salsuginis TaxID=418750 RepID=A0A918KGM5_9GAMM|nr:DeoR/GlpR family DNA-binding transcription regulator [Saccharospirillum salsuginis]GGX62779.1 glycerol-3-phosphate regulon repressor [Saccharospirillum salsuginis]
MTTETVQRSTPIKNRQEQILEWAREEHQLTVDSIARRFDVTPQTIRRDINQLCEQGLLRRHYGGVSLPTTPAPDTMTPTANDVPPIERPIDRLARRIADTIPEKASVSLGSGANMVAVAKALLGHQSLKVLTNNLGVASALSENRDIEVIVSGGQYRHQENDVVGPEVTHFFSSFYSDYGIIETDSLDPQHGMIDIDIRQAEAHRAVISNTRTRILLAGQDRWGQSAVCKVATFKYIDRFYTDHLPDSLRADLPGSMTVIEPESSSD